nr:Na+/H+ antiporter subunit E [Rubellimicrobium sp. CFH 75288]
MFALNVFLALAWAALSEDVTPGTLAAGFVMGFVTLWALRPLFGVPRTYFLRTFFVLRLLVMFLWELLVSSLQVAWDVITPGQGSRPALLEVPLAVQGELGILLLTNLISMTPGTLSVDVSDDRQTLLVHAMFAENPDAIRRQIKTGMERWVMEALGQA